MSKALYAFGLVAALFLSACGGQSAFTPPPVKHLAVINHSDQSMDDLLLEWAIAQRNIAQDGVFLDPLRRADLVRDARALSSAFEDIEVRADDDFGRKPVCIGTSPQCAWTDLRVEPNVVHIAKSLQFPAPTYYVVYEFENVMLARLGYSTEKR
jgi:hypothetical protein